MAKFKIDIDIDDHAVDSRPGGREIQSNVTLPGTTDMFQSTPDPEAGRYV